MPKEIFLLFLLLNLLWRIYNKIILFLFLLLNLLWRIFNKIILLLMIPEIFCCILLNLYLLMIQNEARPEAKTRSPT